MAVKETDAQSGQQIDWNQRSDTAGGSGRWAGNQRRSQPNPQPEEQQNIFGRAPADRCLE